MKIKKVQAVISTGYVGAGYREVFTFDADTPDSLIDEIIQEWLWNKISYSWSEIEND